MTFGVALLGSVPGSVIEGLRSRRGSSLQLARTCSSFEEVMGACQAGTAQVALFLEGSEFLDTTTVDRLRALGVVVLVLHGDPERRERLELMGAIALPLDAGQRELEEAVNQALGYGLHDDDGGPGRRTGLSGDPAVASPDHDGILVPEAGRETNSVRSAARSSSWSHLPVSPGLTTGDPDEAGHDAGDPGKPAGLPAGRISGPDTGPQEPGMPSSGVPKVLAVWGPVGSLGRTTIAVNLAAELALEGRRVILIDADSYGASIAASLGLLDESAGLAQACRLADLAQLDRRALARLCVPVQVRGRGMDVLSGITRPDRWTELRGPALGRVLDLCAEVYDHVVIDTGFCLESDEELSFDTMAPRRNAATLCALEHADRIFAVGEATALGVPRLVRSVPLVKQLAPEAEMVVLMNKVRSASLGRFPERQLRDAWERFGPEMPIDSFLPFSPDIVDAALREGEVLAERSPEAELRIRLQSLVCATAQRSRRSSVFYATTRRWRSR